jgi:hypothetical protein
MSIEQRRGLIEPEHGQLSIVRQCELVSISRSSFYHRPAKETAETLTLMRLIDAQFLDTPWYGSRQMVRHLLRERHEVGRKRIRRLRARWVWRQFINARERRCRIRKTGSIHTCCEAWWWTHPSEPGLVRGHEYSPSHAYQAAMNQQDGSGRPPLPFRLPPPAAAGSPPACNPRPP